MQVGKAVQRISAMHAAYHNRMGDADDAKDIKSAQKFGRKSKVANSPLVPHAVFPSEPTQGRGPDQAA
jgi:hypothetical protein